MAQYSISECEDMASTFHNLAECASSVQLRVYLRGLENHWQARLGEAKRDAAAYDRMRDSMEPGVLHKAVRDHNFVRWGNDQKRCTNCHRVVDIREDEPGECV